MKEIFNFGEVEISKNTSYLQPGQYVLSMRDAKYVKPEGTKTDGTAKTPYVDVTLGGESGEMSVKFYITPKAFERIQTIYVAWFGEKCVKSFDSTDAIGAFFEKAFGSEKAKKISRRVIVGGKQALDGKIYAELPYSKYIISDEDENFKEGPFDPNSLQYIYHVKTNPANASTNTNDVMIPVSNGNRQVNSNFDSDLPF